IRTNSLVNLDYTWFLNMKSSGTFLLTTNGDGSITCSVVDPLAIGTVNATQLNANGILVNGTAAFSNPPYASAISLTNEPMHAFALASQLPTPPLIVSTFHDLNVAGVLPSESFVISNIDFLVTNG